MSGSGYTVTPPRQTLGGQTTRTQTVTASGDLVTIQRETREQTLAVQAPTGQPVTGHRETAAERAAREYAMVQEGVSIATFKGNQFAAGGNANFRVEGEKKAIADIKQNKFKVEKDMDLRLRGAGVGLFIGGDDPELGNEIDVKGTYTEDAQTYAAAAANAQQQALQQALANVPPSVQQTILAAMATGPQTVATTEQTFMAQVVSTQAQSPIVEPEQKPGFWGSIFGRKK